MIRIAIIIYWCLASAPVDTFNPHQVDAGERFVHDNPATCSSDLPLEVFGPSSVEECRGWAMLRYMPGWQQRNPEKHYLYADCFEVHYSPVPIDNAKRKVSP